MTLDQHFQQLSACLPGIFQNREQALANPAWFVHLRLWIRPIPLFAEDSSTFFIEQASAAFKQAPYRQRVLRLKHTTDALTAEYYALQAPQKFQGAAEDVAQLHQLTPEHLQPLAGSCLGITAIPQGDVTRFEARQAQTERCEFTVNGETKFVELGFDAIAPNQPTSNIKAAFWMYDKGVDPATGKYTWGATNGPFELIKVHD